MGGDGEALRGARTGEAEGKQANRWRLVLVWFLRLLSAFWLAKGLTAWMVIFGLPGNKVLTPKAQPLLATQVLKALDTLPAPTR